MNTVVIISAGAEWRAVKELVPGLEIQHSPYGEFARVTTGFLTSLDPDIKPLTLFHGGWGKISAAATAQYVIDHFQPDLLVNLGTCGGFDGRIEAGAIMLVERTLVYDIIEQMGDSAEAIDHYTTDIDLSWLNVRQRILDIAGEWNRPILRGQLISADRDIVAQDIPMLIEKYNAVAADWESGAIAWVASRNNIRLLILRGVTDLVGRDGGEAYGKVEIFHERTKNVMRELFQHLPFWLAGIK